MSSQKSSKAKKLWFYLFKPPCFGKFDCVINSENPKHRVMYPIRDKPSTDPIVRKICPYWDECEKQRRNWGG